MNWLLVIGIVMTLSLLPFFEWFRGTPHQLAAIAQLEEEIEASNPSLLSSDADWFSVWKESGLAHRVVVPYFHQLDHKSGQGYRMCFTTSAAMVAAFYGVVSDQDEYSKVRDKYGDTIYVKSHVQALREYGLDAVFRNDASDQLIEAEISANRPVLVGWMHHGDLRHGPPICDERGCGHWSVIVGFDKDFWYMHDPMGQVDIEHGGHFNKYGGKNNKIPRAGFRQRWQVEGPGTGWVITVSDL